MSCILPLLFSIPLCLSIFALSFSPPHVVWLFIPLYYFPPSPPLSSLTHIWFLSSDLCVFGVTQSSVGLPANTYVCFSDDDRAMARVYVCRLMGLPVRVCRVQQVMQQFLNDPQMRHCTLLVCHSFVLRSDECPTGGRTAGFGPRTLICLGNCGENWWCFKPGDQRWLMFVCLQLLDLFLQWDWSTYLADYGKPTCKYLRVNPHTALALLDKWVESTTDL